MTTTPIPQPAPLAPETAQFIDLTSEIYTGLSLSGSLPLQAAPAAGAAIDEAGGESDSLKVTALPLTGPLLVESRAGDDPVFLSEDDLIAQSDDCQPASDEQPAARLSSGGLFDDSLAWLDPAGFNPFDTGL